MNTKRAITNEAAFVFEDEAFVKVLNMICIAQNPINTSIKLITELVKKIAV